MILKNLFLCEAVSPNPDNTFSVLRGGINIFNISIPQGKDPSQLPPIKMGLVATVELEITEMGRLHNLEVTLMDGDGHRVIPELRLNFQPPTSQRKGYHNIIIDLFTPFKTPGEYCFYINVDGHELGSIPFNVIHHQVPGPGGNNT
ncbi:MAG: hypothetical protein A3F87_01225 [Omnitrophica WOR_2 bacterium RIFCSPLOWO2_12_FULL_51_24]|nr:MAG: hypothetical protein A3F87_01225 [Omnitrophica WOR_2 bacterium RIFCSPLOWO2_12_FULL_51_24]